jgi:hypothetical protein
MAEKRWGYIMGIFTVDDKGPYGTGVSDYGAELIGISPYKIVAQFSEHMKSEDFDHVKNAQQLGDFIRWIGDKNTLSVKKLHDDKFQEFLDLSQNNIQYGIVGLAVSPMDAMPKGANHLAWMNKHKSEAVLMRRVSLSAAWTDGDYDWVTFVADKVDFYFF